MQFVFYCGVEAQLNNIFKQGIGIAVEIVNLRSVQYYTRCQACLDAQQSREKYQGRKCPSYFYTVINISFTKAGTIL